MSDEREVAESIRRIIAGGGADGGSNATAEALRRAGIDVTPHGPQPSRPGGQGRGLGVSTPAGDTSGIASPLTEVVDDDGNPVREYHDTPITSTDGLLTIPAVKTLKMTDANGREVVFEYAEPKDPQGGTP